MKRLRFRLTKVSPLEAHRPLRGSRMPGTAPCLSMLISRLTFPRDFRDCSRSERAREHLRERGYYCCDSGSRFPPHLEDGLQVSPLVETLQQAIRCRRLQRQLRGPRAEQKGASGGGGGSKAKKKSRDTGCGGAKHREEQHNYYMTTFMYILL